MVSFLMNLIVATNRTSGISLSGSIPWTCKEDLLFFRMMTIGETVIMGSTTFKSLGCRPLSDRQNLIVTRSTDLHGVRPAQNALYCPIELAFSESHIGDRWVIGGSQIYSYALTNNLIKTIYKSTIEDDTPCDLHFTVPPEFRRLSSLRLSPECTLTKYQLIKESNNGPDHNR